MHALHGLGSAVLGKDAQPSDVATLTLQSAFASCFVTCPNPLAPDAFNQTTRLRLWCTGGQRLQGPQCDGPVETLQHGVGDLLAQVPLHSTAVHQSAHGLLRSHKRSQEL